MRRALLFLTIVVAGLAAGYAAATDYNPGGLVYSVSVHLYAGRPAENMLGETAGYALDLRRPVPAHAAYTAGYTLYVNDLRVDYRAPSYTAAPVSTTTVTTTRTVTTTISGTPTTTVVTETLQVPLTRTVRGGGVPAWALAAPAALLVLLLVLARR